jgi:CBS domain-containing protein
LSAGVKQEDSRLQAEFGTALSFGPFAPDLPHRDKVVPSSQPVASRIGKPARIRGFGGVMAQVNDLIKDRRLYSIEADRTVLEAARFMMEHNIGALPVLRDGELVGIVSERDIMNRAVAIGRMPGTTQVSEIMTANPKSVAAEESVDECLFIMREFGFRHLLVTESKKLKGLVSLRDILLRYVAEKEAESRRVAS